MSENEPSEFRFHQLRYSSDGKKFTKSWELAFEREFDQRAYDWLFSEHTGNHVYVAECNYSGEIAAGYCMLEQTAIADGVETKCFLCNNVFSSPKFRQHNLFVRLGRHVLSLCDKAKAIAIGIPNSLALPGHRRVGWTPLPSLPFVSRDPSLDDSLNHLDVRELTLADLSRVEEISRNNTLDASFFIIKTPKFFRWRYFDRPLIGRDYYRFSLFEHGEMVGYLILSHYHQEQLAHILDANAFTESQLDSLIKYAVDSASRLGVRRINSWASPASITYLSRTGFARDNSDSNFIAKQLGTWGESSCQELFCRSLISLGDNDVF